MKFLGRVDYEKYSRAMRIQIIPKNGKSLMQFIYHPDIPGMHWDQLKLTLITNLPILGNYLLQGKLQ